MALGIEVGLGPGHIVLPSPKKGTEPPNFGPFLQRAALQALY